jgi:hypothetical protein
LNADEDEDVVDKSEQINGLGLAESSGLRAAIKRTLRKGLGDEYKDLLASAVRVLEKLEIQRALVKALSEQGTEESHQRLKEVIERSINVGIDTPEFVLAREMVERDSYYHGIVSATVSPCHISDDGVACQWNLEGGIEPAETSMADRTVKSPSSTPSPARLQSTPNLLQVFDNGGDADDIVHVFRPADSHGLKSPAQRKRETGGMLTQPRRRAPPLASLVTEPWAELSAQRSLDHSLFERMAAR